MKIPVIDFAEYDETEPSSIERLAQEVDTALSETGFMSIKNHGLSSELIHSMFAHAKAFFESDTLSKNQLGYGSAEENFGYQGVGQEALDPGKPRDLKESLTIRNPYQHLDAQWPSNEFRDQCLIFFDELYKVAHRVMRVFSSALEVDSEYFVDKHKGDNVTFRLLHYPALQAQLPDQMGAGAHTDYGMLTLLLQDMVGGLEVYDNKNDQWQTVDPVSESIVINTGDLTEHWTNGRYPSTLHRVKPRDGVSDRYSIAMFFDPDDDVIVDCLPSCVSVTNPAKYKPVNASEHILAKIKATH